MRAATLLHKRHELCEREESTRARTRVWSQNTSARKERTIHQGLAICNNNAQRPDYNSFTIPNKLDACAVIFCPWRRARVCFVDSMFSLERAEFSSDLHNQRGARGEPFQVRRPDAAADITILFETNDAPRVH